MSTIDNSGVVGDVRANFIGRCQLITSRLVVSTYVCVRSDRFGPSVTAPTAVVFVDDLTFEAVATVCNGAGLVGHLCDLANLSLIRFVQDSLVGVRSLRADCIITILRCSEFVSSLWR